MARKQKVDITKLNIAAVRKASNILKLDTEKSEKKSLLYPVTECLQYLKNMYTKPVYTQLAITNYAWTKLMAFIHLVGDYEISGFGRIKNGTIIDFDIIRQEVKSAYVESDADSVLEFIMNTPSDQREEWILDWHSHVNMGTTPSSTDWTNYSEMYKARQHKQFPAMIVNKKGNVTANQIICEERHTDIKIFVDTTPLEEIEIEKIYEVCKNKVEHYCTKAAPATSSWTGYGQGYGQDYYGWHGYSRWDDDWEDTTTNDKTTKKLTIDDDEAPRLNAFDLTAEQIRQMEKQGIVFDEETGEAYEEDECCNMCFKPLKTETELEYGVCMSCFQKAMQEEALKQ